MHSGDFSRKKQIAEIRTNVRLSGKYEMIYDNVLIEIDHDLSKDFMKDGIWLSLNTDKHNADNTIRHGIIRGVPEKFIFREDYGFGADWKNKIQINEGDRVWFSIVGSSESEKIIIDNKLYFIVPYKELIVAKRKIVLSKTGTKFEFVIEEDGFLYEIVMLNGFVLVQPKMMKQNEFIKLPPKKSKDCVVCFCGEPNSRYFKGHFFDDDRINIGDTIRVHLFHKYLEDMLHKNFDGDREYMVIQRRHLNYKY